MASSGLIAEIARPVSHFSSAIAQALHAHTPPCLAHRPRLDIVETDLALGEITKPGRSYACQPPFSYWTTIPRLLPS